MQVAQGRVWTGAQARDRGLVDHVGGLWRALQVADHLRTVPRWAESQDDTGTTATTNSTVNATSTTNTTDTNTTNTSTTTQPPAPYKVYKVENLNARGYQLPLLSHITGSSSSGGGLHSVLSEIIGSVVRGVVGGNGVKGVFRVMRGIQKIVSAE